MKPVFLLTTAAFGMLFLTTACDAAEQTSAIQESSAHSPSTPPSAAMTAAPPAADAPPSAADAPAGPPLADYIGKYPFDAVNGVTWEDHPLVKAGMERSLTDAKVRDAIATTSGPSVPIAMKDGKVAAWSCQQHRCNEHSWAVMVDPASGATDVCYVNETTLANQSRWFLANGTQETRDTDCSLEE